MTDIFQETEQQLDKLEKEVEDKKKLFRTKFELLEKQKIDVDEELLKDFLEEYWFIHNKGENEYEIIVPRWLNFSVGWLDRTTKGYNVFVINKYTQWLGQIPDFLRKELQIVEPEKIKFDGENVIFEEGKEKMIKDKFNEFISGVSNGSARVKKGKEFDLIAAIIDSGSLPFIPKSVDKIDLRETQTNFNFDNKYKFQQDCYETFLKYGAIGVYWMTGAGKSFLSMHILDSLIGNKLLVVPTITLKEQWKEYFKNFAPRLLNEVDIETYQAYEKLKNKEYIIIVFDECLHGNSKIMLKDKTEKNIREIVEKQNVKEVLSFNEEKQLFESKKILRYIKQPISESWLKLQIKDSENHIYHLILTANHKVWTDHGYKRVDELNKKDILKVYLEPVVYNHNAKIISIKNLQKHSRGYKYNLEIADNHNYVANKILVSNCHVLPANTFSKLATLKTKYRLGLSATPFREDERTNYIFALTGYPVGLEWNSLMKILGKKYHDVNVYIVNNDENKIKLLSNLLNLQKKTIIFVNELEIGHQIANKLGIPFIHGATKDRMSIAKNSKVFVASRVMELGVSLKDLNHIIEVDFLFGSKREEVQRTGRLFHSERAERHDIIFTKDEFEKYSKRLHGMIEKGFKINLRPMISGEFKLVKRKIEKNESQTTSDKVTEIINNMFDDGYFVSERTFRDVINDIGKKGIPISAKQHISIISSNMLRLVKEKKIYKIKRGGTNFHVQR